MAANTQKVRSALLKSSMNIGVISKGANVFVKALSRSRKISQNIAKSTSDDNKVQRRVLVDEASWFRRRRQAVLKREKENEIEAAGVGGAMKTQGKVMSSSTKGFLGRILDVFGILLLGWMIRYLPRLIKGISTLIKTIQTAVTFFTEAINVPLNFVIGIGQGLTNVLEQITPFDFSPQEKEIRKGMEDIDGGLNLVDREIGGAFRTLGDPSSYGFSSWNEVDEVGKEKEKKPEGAKRNFAGFADFMTFGIWDFDKRGNLFGGQHGRSGHTNVDQEEYQADENEEPEFGSEAWMQKYRSRDNSTTGEDEQTQETDKEKTKDQNNEEDLIQGESTTGDIPDVKSDQLQEVKNKDGGGDGEPPYMINGKKNPAWEKWYKGESEAIEKDPPLDMFADGGRPEVGKTSIVGEKGPELFVADKPGTIVPNSYFKDRIDAQNEEQKAYEKELAAIKKKKDEGNRGFLGWRSAADWMTGGLTDLDGKGNDFNLIKREKNIKVQEPFKKKKTPIVVSVPTGGQSGGVMPSGGGGTSPMPMVASVNNSKETIAKVQSIAYAYT
tara:strand:- start:4870 stop:6531 length:1662 start_codon:yes stop_codon:yes gene_type:complete